MNWQEVEKQFPHSMVKFRNWAYQKNMGYNPHKRALYDFFDAEEIIIELGVDWNCLGYIYRISQSKWVQSCSTRTEAEEQAFTKAFEILEEKLKEGR